MSRNASGTPSTPLLSPGLILLYVKAFLMAVGIMVLTFAEVFHLADAHGAGASIIGLATGLQGLAYLAGCLVFIFARRSGGIARDFHVLYFAAPALALFTVLFYRAEHLTSAIAFIVGIGAASALLWPPLMGVVSSRAEGPRLNRLMGLYNLSWSLGPVLAPLLGGYLYMIGAKPTFITAAVFLVAGGLIYLFFRSRYRHVYKTPASPQSLDTDEYGDKEAGDRPTADRPARRIAGWIYLFADHVVTGLILHIMPLYLRGDRGLNEFSVGTVFFARAAVMTGGMVILGRVDFWHDNRRAANVSAVLFIGALAAMILFEANLPVVIGGIVLAGLLNAFFFSSGIYHGVAGSTRRSVRMAISESVLTAGIFVGSAVGGPLYQRFGIKTSLLFAAATLTVSVVSVAIVDLVISRPLRRRQPFTPSKENLS